MQAELEKPSHVKFVKLDDGDNYTVSASNNESHMRNVVCATDCFAYNDENDSVKTFYLSEQEGFLKNMNFVEG